ncbi:hypothetical protein SAMN05192583_1980 [Sphingomonas gellani]|uniref:Uncharacterized protein n=1 Tax=Sphingomonas gellani TaxID=1166340 RepID=A0A1H8DN89_9SPHN|nr:hypothetical protein [Sphingomonas gellani]SEN08284.1 hypothetical protein SAMN05192583_1980 [Sphingomonas gellani]
MASDFDSKTPRGRAIIPCEQKRKQHGARLSRQRRGMLRARACPDMLPMIVVATLRPQQIGSVDA